MRSGSARRLGPLATYCAAMSDSTERRSSPPSGVAGLLPDLSEEQLRAAPVLANVDALTIEDLSEAEDDPFTDALGRGMPVVWVFHGDGARFASAVFESETDAAAWIARHGLSGVLAAYPVNDCCYGIAVRDGHFRPTRPHHGKAEHVSAFSPGWTRHIHFDHGRPA